MVVELELGTVVPEPAGTEVVVDEGACEELVVVAAAPGWGIARWMLATPFTVPSRVIADRLAWDPLR